MSVFRPAIVAALLAWATPAAGGDGVSPVTDPVVLKECGACHMAFPPAFLPARSWRRLVHGLSDHFGEDASLPVETMDIIGTYLMANAGDVALLGVARKYMRWVAPKTPPSRASTASRSRCGRTLSW